MMAVLLASCSENLGVVSMIEEIEIYDIGTTKPTGRVELTSAEKEAIQSLWDNKKELNGPDSWPPVDPNSVPPLRMWSHIIHLVFSESVSKKYPERNSISYLYNCSLGKISVLTKSPTPVYQISDPAAFNEILGINEC
ncbi:MAG: hypothetical protein HKM24_01535 [Gammaproteobacteria bacterium]|nr:hypothetical protein [Gammaproteobacteria bacterium]